MIVTRVSFLVAILAVSATVLGAQATASAKDIDRLVGPGWKGTLTYRDYTTEARTTIKSALLLQRVPAAGEAESRWDMRIAYADEPHANSGDTISLSKDGRYFRNATVTERQQLPNGDIRFVTESDGKDNEKPARIRTVYLVGEHAASIQKFVRYQGGDYFERHIYEWTR